MRQCLLSQPAAAPAVHRTAWVGCVRYGTPDLAPLRSPAPRHSRRAGGRCGARTVRDRSEQGAHCQQGARPRLQPLPAHRAARRRARAAAAELCWRAAQGAAQARRRGVAAASPPSVRSGEERRTRAGPPTSPWRRRRPSCRAPWRRGVEKQVCVFRGSTHLTLRHCPVTIGKVSK